MLLTKESENYMKKFFSLPTAYLLLASAIPMVIIPSTQNTEQTAGAPTTKQWAYKEQGPKHPELAIDPIFESLNASPKESRTPYVEDDQLTPLIPLNYCTSQHAPEFPDRNSCTYESSSHDQK